MKERKPKNIYDYPNSGLDPVKAYTKSEARALFKKQLWDKSGWPVRRKVSPISVGAVIVQRKLKKVVA